MNGAAGSLVGIGDVQGVKWNRENRFPKSNHRPTNECLVMNFIGGIAEMRPMRGLLTGPRHGSCRNPEANQASASSPLGARARWMFCLTLALTISGCATSERISSAKDTRQTTADQTSYLAGHGIQGKPSIVISLAEQKAFFYKSQQLVGISPVSTGKEGRATPPGKFSITERDKDHLSAWYGDYVDSHEVVVKANVDCRKDPRPPGAHFAGAPMPYFMRVTGGIGMHQGYLPGVPASHGCIRMPAMMAEAFYNEAPLGTLVTIKN
jgi:L,D-transpeptidase catalytic domain